MKPSLITTTCCAVLLIGMHLACARDDLQRWRPSDPTYVPFPVVSIAVSSDNSFAALTVNEHPHNDEKPVGADSLSTYVLDLRNGEHRKFGSGTHFFLPAPHAHIFLYYDAFGISQESPKVLDGSNVVRTLNIGEHNGGWWNPRTNDALFETSWPSDRDGFIGLTIVDVSTGKSTNVHLREPTELLSFCPATGNFYSEHWYDDGSVPGVDEYGLHGSYIESARRDRAVFSAQCRYVLPFAALAPHGPSDWAVYDAKSGAELQRFAWIEDGKHDLHWFIAWNPVNDHLLLMHSNKPNTNIGSVDVLDVRSGAIVQSILDEEHAPVVWSGDGKSTVTIRDHRVTFSKLAPALLASR